MMGRHFLRALAIAIAVVALAYYAFLHESALEGHWPKATIVTVQNRDATEPARGTFDRVLVDPPCSDLGTLASRPDARWQRRAADVPDRAPQVFVFQREQPFLERLRLGTQVGQQVAANELPDYPVIADHRVGEVQAVGLPFGRGVARPGHARLGGVELEGKDRDCDRPATRRALNAVARTRRWWLERRAT